MSSGCGDVLSLEDLRIAKLHQLFEAEVITGKQGGVAGGADIDYATNQVTGQVQKTLPAVLRDAGFEPASFDFTTGGTLSASDRNKAVLWPSSSGGDGEYYFWQGALPKIIPASSTPATAGGVSNGAWRPVGDIGLRDELSSDNGASMVGSSSGDNVQVVIDDLSSEIANTNEVLIPGVRTYVNSSIKTSAYVIDNIKDQARQYDGFGNTVFFNGRNLFCFRRAYSHLDDMTSVSSVCIAEIFKDGSTQLIWEYKPDLGTAAKEPHISVTVPSNVLVISFSLHDVSTDTYFKAIVGYPNLSQSGNFSSKSDITTTTGYYMWGNVVQSPDGKLLASRYNVSGQEVQIISSSDQNLNGSTSWSLVKSFPVSLFANRTLINEICIGYYKNQLVAVIRANNGSAASGIIIAKTSDMTGVNGWSYIISNFVFAAPRIECFTEFDDPLVITGTASRSVSPAYRSDSSMTMTYDLSSFSSPQVIYQADYFSCYCSAKKVSDGIYELISFDEIPDSGAGENFETNIHRQYFYLPQDNHNRVTTKYNKDWMQSVISGSPCYGDLSTCNTTQSSSNMYFSFNEAVNSIARIFIMVGPVASALTITPTIKNMDGSTFATCFNVTVPVNTKPQIVEIIPASGSLSFSSFSMLNLNFSSALPIGSIGGVVGARLPVTNRLPFGLYNVLGVTTSPYLNIAFGKL